MVLSGLLKHTFAMFLMKYNLKSLLHHFKKELYLLFSVVLPIAVYFSLLNHEKPHLFNDSFSKNSTDYYNITLEHDQTRENFLNFVFITYFFVCGCAIAYLFDFLNNLIWELRHISVYENYKAMFKVLSKNFKYYKLCLTIVVLPGLMIFLQSELNHQCLLFTIIGYFSGLNNVKITNYEWRKIREKQDVDYSRSLAFWYYEGYLKKVLSTTTDAPFSRRINSYEQQHGVTIKTPKLLILLPTSCNINDNLEDCDENGVIEHADDLIELNHLSNSQTNRVFKMSTYRVKKTNDEWFYCLTEIATPLKRVANTKIQKFQVCKAELANNFYFHLKDLIKNGPPGLADACVLIPYRDINDNGSAVPLSKVLIKAIEKESSKIPHVLTLK